MKYGFIVIFIVLWISSACTPKGRPEDSNSNPQSLAERGKSIYATSCTACHNMDPRLDGSVGPSVAGASKELIERRVVYGDYPPNYEPKRKSRLMVALPHLKSEVDAISAYLNSIK